MHSVQILNVDLYPVWWYVVEHSFVMVSGSEMVLPYDRLMLVF